ncbi:MAG: hypothetical protein MZU91_01270 [Desulfosudis oleivorans]|nr:hypothetical protein [Desulfosudis oleivorans]
MARSYDALTSFGPVKLRAPPDLHHRPGRQDRQNLPRRKAGHAFARDTAGCESIAGGEEDERLAVC